MLGFVLKRLFRFIPSLIALSLLIFGLSRLSPGDPVLNALEEFQNSGRTLRTEQETKLIQELKKELGLDNPAFYFSLNRQSDISNYIGIENPSVKANFNELSYRYASGELASIYFQTIVNQDKNKHLLTLNNAKQIEVVLESIQSPEINKAWQNLKNNESKRSNYTPAFKWNGLNNQYHNWIGNFIQGDFGISFFDKKPITAKISQALPWTIILSLISIVLALAIAIPTGVYAAIHKDSRADKTLNRIFFGFFAIPNFWLASILVVFFTNPEHFNWFPSYGTGEINSDTSTLQLIGTRIHHLALPIIVWTYGSIAFVFRQVRSSMIKQLESEYIRTAMAKGLAFKTIVWKHAFKNASFPLITIIGAAIPAVFSGSFVVEYIFSIPGMGMLTIQSFTTRDFPVIFSVLMLMGAFTIIGLLIADILYAWNDPKIRFNQSKN